MSRVLLVASRARSLLHFRAPLISELLRRNIAVTCTAPDITQDIADHLQALGADWFEIPLGRRGLNPIRDVISAWHLHQAIRGMGTVTVVPYTLKPILVTGLAHRLASEPGWVLVPMFTGLGYMRRIYRARLRLVQKVFQFVLRDTSVTIVQNDADADWLRAMEIVPYSCIRAVPGSGVDLQHYSPTAVAMGAHTPMAIYIGRMLPEKGILRFANIAKTLGSTVRWLAVGAFENRRDQQRFLPMLRDAGVEYVPPVTDIRPLLGRASVLLYPTLYGEGVPRVILEAMAMRIPVIATPEPGCAAALSHNVSGLLVPADDHAGWVDAVRRVLSDSHLSHRLTQAASREVQARFEARRVAALTADAILSAAASEPI